MREDFNSHPHEEDDLCSRNYRSRQYISTHILTKRMTKPPFDGLFAIPISTHILTKRMTASCQSFGGMESFQLTSSRRGWRRVDWRPVDHINFNSHPHEEDDNVLLAILLSPNLISTHILTKRMTRENRSYNHRRRYFNSHPHEEDDSVPSMQPKDDIDISTHILTKRMTGNQRVTDYCIVFQLTSSRRGWRKNRPYCSWLTGISTHILTKRMTVLFPYWVCCHNISTHILTKRMTLW